MAKTNLEIVQEELSPYLVSAPPVDAKAEAEERLTMDTLRTTVEEVLAKDFGGRYLIAADIVELQTTVRNALKRRFKKTTVNIKPVRGGGFSIEIEGL